MKVTITADVKLEPKDIQLLRKASVGEVMDTLRYGECVRSMKVSIESEHERRKVKKDAKPAPKITKEEQTNDGNREDSVGGAL